MTNPSRPLRLAGSAALMLATLMLGGCALAMLNGAANSGSSSVSSSSGNSAPSAPNRQAADSALSTSVRSKLAANPALKALNLSVDTHDGIVTLRGQVASVDQRNAAQRDAGTVKGVKSVQNFIVVR